MSDTLKYQLSPSIRMVRAQSGEMPLFFKACELAKIATTARQLSKWKRRKGLAATYRFLADTTIKQEAFAARIAGAQ